MSYRYKSWLPLLLAAIIFLLPGCDGQRPTAAVYADTAEELAAMHERVERDPDDIEALRRIWAIHTHAAHDSLLIAHATPFYNKAIATGDRELQLYAGVYIGQAYLMLDKPDSMFRYFGEISALADQTDNDWALCCINNALGVHALYFDMNYNKVLSHFMKALGYAEKLDDENNYNVLLANIAMTYYLRNDTTGMKYAQEVYERSSAGADKPNAAYSRFIGASTLGYMHFLRRDYEQALEYAHEAETLSEEYHDKVSTFTLLGNIYAATGNDRKAESYYKQALGLSAKADAKSASFLAYSYGNYLLEKKKYEQAIPVFHTGLNVAEQHNNYLYRYRLYLGLSEAYDKLGAPQQALHNHRIYHAQADSIFNIEREHSLAELRVQYESEKQEKELKQKELQLMREGKKLQVSIFMLVIILTVAGMIYILYSRKNRMYRQLVMQHQEYLQKEKQFKSKGQVPETPVIPETDKAGDAPSEKDEELFSRLTALMRDGHIYRENDISIEKLADMLGSNRSYISRIINLYAGMSFTSFINSYRIDEAVRVLSNPEDETPLKALSDNLGYNSLTSFYRSFQKATSVPPSKYREEVRKLHRKNFI